MPWFIWPWAWVAKNQSNHQARQGLHRRDILTHPIHYPTDPPSTRTYQFQMILVSCVKRLTYWPGISRLPWERFLPPGLRVWSSTRKDLVGSRSGSVRLGDAEDIEDRGRRNNSCLLTFRLKRLDLFFVHRLHINLLRFLLRDSGDKQKLHGARDGTSWVWVVGGFDSLVRSRHSLLLLKARRRVKVVLNGSDCTGGSLLLLILFWSTLKWVDRCCLWQHYAADALPTCTCNSAGEMAGEMAGEGIGIFLSQMTPLQIYWGKAGVDAFQPFRFLRSILWFLFLDVCAEGVIIYIAHLVLKINKDNPMPSST